MSKKTATTLSQKQTDELLQVLMARFEKHPQRHKGLNWQDVLKRLQNNSDAIFTLSQMESTGGEPDVIGYDKKAGEFIYCDCSEESPKGRRSVCYDKEALDSRKEHKPKTSALEMAAQMGIEILNEEQYRELQQLGEFDLKTSSWLKTPIEIRKLDGAIFGDRRYDHVFIYHNGASSYYAARGFRGILRI